MDGALTVLEQKEDGVQSALKVNQEWLKLSGSHHAIMLGDLPE